MSPPVDLDPKRFFSKSQRDSILWRQASLGADGLWRAFCDVCKEPIAEMTEATAKWASLIPHQFDHILAWALGGRTDPRNGRALCSHPRPCHAVKSAVDVGMIAKAEAQGGRTGQYARRKADKLAGKKSWGHR